VFTTVFLAACSTGNPGTGDGTSPTATAGGENNTQEPGSGADDEKIADEFNSLVEKEKNPGKLLEFINANISNASEKTATRMVLKLEDAQNAYIGELEKQYSDADMQAALMEIFKDGVYNLKAEDIRDINTDEEVKAMLAETLACGYRIETAEGTFFPIIDYSIYLAYAGYVSPDIAAYHKLMAAESDKVPAKDAALVITWDEVVERALNMEKFLDEYGDSPRVDAVENLYLKYITFTYFGLNNTPLYEYGSKKMRTDAKEAYLKAISSNTSGSGDISSEYIKQLAEFMKLAENENYKLTDAIEEYRKDLGGF